MKKILLIIPVLLLTISISNAQIEVKLGQDSISYYDGTIYAANTTLTGTPDEISTVWGDFLKKEYKVKSSSKKDVILSKEIQFKYISRETGDLILKLEDLGNNQTKVSMAFRLGYTICLNTILFKDDFEKMRSFLEYFAFFYYNEIYSTDIKSLQKESDDLKKEINNLYKDNDKLSSSNTKMTKTNNSNSKKITKSNDKLKNTTDSDEKAKISDEITKLQDKTTENSNQIEINNLKIEQNTKDAAAKNIKVEKIAVEIEANEKVKTIITTNLSRLAPIYKPVE